MWWRKKWIHKATGEKIGSKSLRAIDTSNFKPKWVNSHHTILHILYMCLYVSPNVYICIHIHVKFVCLRKCLQLPRSLGQGFGWIQIPSSNLLHNSGSYKMGCKENVPSWTLDTSQISKCKTLIRKQAPIGWYCEKWGQIGPYLYCMIRTGFSCAECREE